MFRTLVLVFLVTTITSTQLGSSHEVGYDQCYWAGQYPVCFGHCPPGYHEVQRARKDPGYTDVPDHFGHECLAGEKRLCCRSKRYMVNTSHQDSPKRPYYPGQEKEWPTPQQDMPAPQYGDGGQVYPGRVNPYEQRKVPVDFDYGGQKGMDQRTYPMRPTGAEPREVLALTPFPTITERPSQGDAWVQKPQGFPFFPGSEGSGSEPSKGVAEGPFPAFTKRPSNGKRQQGSDQFPAFPGTEGPGAGPKEGARERPFPTITERPSNGDRDGPQRNQPGREVGSSQTKLPFDDGSIFDQWGSNGRGTTEGPGMQSMPGGRERPFPTITERPPNGSREGPKGNLPDPEVGSSQTKLPFDDGSIFDQRGSNDRGTTEGPGMQSRPGGRERPFPTITERPSGGNRAGPKGNLPDTEVDSSQTKLPLDDGSIFDRWGNNGRGTTEGAGAGPRPGARERPFPTITERPSDGNTATGPKGGGRAENKHPPAGGKVAGMYPEIPGYEGPRETTKQINPYPELGVHNEGLCYWKGTSPFCNPNECHKGFYEAVRAEKGPRDLTVPVEAPFGRRCVTGRKRLCCPLSMQNNAVRSTPFFKV